MTSNVCDTPVMNHGIRVLPDSTSNSEQQEQLLWGCQPARLGSSLNGRAHIGQWHAQAGSDKREALQGQLTT